MTTYLVPILWMAAGAAVMLISQRLFHAVRAWYRNQRNSSPVILEDVKISDGPVGSESVIGMPLESAPTTVIADRSFELGPVGAQDNVALGSGPHTGSGVVGERTGMNEFTVGASTFDLIENDDGWLLVRISGREPAQLGSTPMLVDDLRPVTSQARTVSVRLANGEKIFRELPDHYLPRRHAAPGMELNPAPSVLDGRWIIVRGDTVVTACWDNRGLSATDGEEARSILRQIVRHAAPGRSLAVACEGAAEVMEQRLGIGTVLATVADQDGESWLASTRGALKIRTSGSPTDGPHREWSTTLADLWRWNPRAEPILVTLADVEVGRVGRSTHSEFAGDDHVIHNDLPPGASEAIDP